MGRFNKDMKTKDLPIPNLGLTEIALLQVLFYAVFWLMSDYTATLLTLVLPIIFLCLLIISLAAEVIDKDRLSKTPRWYFKFMLISIIVPILTAIVFVMALGANFDWTKL
ncbi:MAG: hypothetical protein AB8G86_05455 [Saprospiraceae bacterium]